MLEKLSKIAHESWADWTNYFFEKGKKNKDGTITIPKWGVERWERWDRQIKTDYENLTEKEKERDRTEAKKYLEVIKSHSKINEEKTSEVDKLIIGFLKNGFEKLAVVQQKEFYKQKEIERFKMIKENFEYLKSKAELTDKEKKELEHVTFLVGHYRL